MKRFFAALTSLTLLVCLCACTGDTETQATTPESSPAATSVPETIVPETTVPETSAPAAQLQIGCYTLTDMTVRGIGTNEETIASLGSYLQILEDHTGVWFVSGAKADIRWDDTTLSTSSAQAEYWFEGDTLVLRTKNDFCYYYDYVGEEIPEEYVVCKAFGTYYAESIGFPDGSVSLFDTLSAANGYLTLNEDGTGYLCCDGKEGAITWDDSLIYLGDSVFKYIYYSEQFRGDGKPSILVGFPDSSTTVLFLLATE